MPAPTNSHPPSPLPQQNAPRNPTSPGADPGQAAARKPKQAETLVQQAEKSDQLEQALPGDEDTDDDQPCSATTRLGNPCWATRRKGRPYCIAHDPQYREQQQKNRQAGGVASGNARRSAADLSIDQCDLSTRVGVQVLIDAVLRLELTGQLPRARSSAIIRLLSLAVRNFDPATDRHLLDSPRARHHPNDYIDHRHAIDLDLPDIARAMADDELRARVQAIAEVGSKRQEFLKANDMFAAAPRPKY